MGFITKLASVLGQLLPADGTLIVVLQPRLDTVWVERVAAGQEHSFLSFFEIGNADRASWSFKFAVAVLLAVLVFYLLDWECVYHTLRRALSLLLAVLSLHPLHMLVNKIGKAFEAEIHVIADASLAENGHTIINNCKTHRSHALWLLSSALLCLVVASEVLLVSLGEIAAVIEV